ncbi:carbohydrate diacid regulator [Terrilactibacillus sp. BCM23-1]|uniref:Carbohydrate diacid regulator n=1 Tax=Terrilactibacillus tamarindi TaxID=2599694 RepID=A0A6N8CTL5_9BACI|nr:sugar diacid recognition domain-containing protein [Terrilactibacillus tamarindi]MTT32577.1 carbohydrate diacid regulator [Terrilactibacillus tamarindi]
MLKPQLAQRIIHEVGHLLHEQIIVVNSEGLIIASTDLNRKGQFHAGAKYTMSTKLTQIMTQEDVKRWPGVKAGINLPIFFQKEVIGVIGITGQAEQVEPKGEILKKMTELMIQESYYQEEIDYHARSLEAFVFDWLNQKERNDVFIHRAIPLNICLDIERQILYIDLNESTQQVVRSIWEDIMNGIPSYRNDIVIRWGSSHLLLILDVSNKGFSLKDEVDHVYHRVMKHLDRPARIGVGSVVPPEKLVKSFQGAERALHATSENEPIVFDESLTLEMIAEDVSPDTKQLFIDRTLASILDKPELIHAIKVLIMHDFSYKEASTDLHIHTNTLHYRVKKFEELTGLNLKQLKTKVILYMGLLFLDEHTKRRSL